MSELNSATFSFQPFETESPTAVCGQTVQGSDLDYLKQKYNYEELASFNKIRVIQKILQAGYAFNMEGKLEAPRKVMATNTPWVFARQDENRHCEVWHRIWFGLLNLLPSPCLECWKVVVRPKTLRDLFRLREIQVEMNRPSKCGIEIRDTVNGHYGGYFYCDSKNEGLLRWAEVKKMVDARMDNETPVILKRGCTEFEAEFGDSARWEEHVTDEQRDFEQFLVDLMPYDSNPPQMDLIKPDVMQRWIEFAWDRADPTVTDFTPDGGPLHAPYTKYHNEYDAAAFQEFFGTQD